MVCGVCCNVLCFHVLYCGIVACLDMLRCVLRCCRVVVLLCFDGLCRVVFGCCVVWCGVAWFIVLLWRVV